ncbi:MAG: hypothetical protein HYU66_20585 [Armatimonadetes bacterium]|nr:hypothetical protein [Armatimonadota bacterium]
MERRVKADLAPGEEDPPARPPTLARRCQETRVPPAPLLRAGFAKADITPPPGVPYLSYYPRQTPFVGVHDRLHARALAAENGSTALAVLSVDSLGLSRGVLGPGRDFIGELRARVSLATGIPADAILIHATHAHSTPQTTDIDSLLDAFPALLGWLEQLLERLAAALVSAWHARDRGTLRGTVGLAPGIAWNRRIVTTAGRLVRLQERPPDDQVLHEPRDDRVPLLLFEGETQRGAVLGFTCHPVTVQVNPLASADYPGVACDILERELDLAACLFLQGACGDVNPVRGTTDFADVARYGRTLAGEALRALSLLDHPAQPGLGTALASRTTTVFTPRRELPDAAPLLRERAAAQEALAAATDDAAREQATATLRRVLHPLGLCALGDGPVAVEVQALRLGDALIVAVEGELFSAYGNALKAASPAAVTFVAGYSNGYQGYFPEPRSWDEGGYEPSLGPWTRVGRLGGDEITAAALALAEQVWSEVPA